MHVFSSASAKSGFLNVPALYSIVNIERRVLDKKAYPPNPNLTPCSLRNCPMALMALAAASQPPSPQNRPFQPYTYRLAYFEDMSSG
jgi:hypothetical protein